MLFCSLRRKKLVLLPVKKSLWTGDKPDQKCWCSAFNSLNFEFLNSVNKTDSRQRLFVRGKFIIFLVFNDTSRCFAKTIHKPSIGQRVISKRRRSNTGWATCEIVIV